MAPSSVPNRSERRALPPRGSRASETRSFSARTASPHSEICTLQHGRLVCCLKGKEQRNLSSAAGRTICNLWVQRASFRTSVNITQGKEKHFFYLCQLLLKSVKIISVNYLTISPFCCRIITRLTGFIFPASGHLHVGI